MTFEIEPQRFGLERGSGEQRYAVMAALVERGLRAQLKSGNLLTGELLVDLDFHPKGPAGEADRSGTYPEIPTVPAQMEALDGTGGTRP